MELDPTRRPKFARTVAVLLAVGVCVAAARCGGNSGTGPTNGGTPPGDPGGGGNPPPPTSSFTFVGAGDIAMCDALDPARQTAALLASIGGTVFTLGDNAYFSGSTVEYQNCYNVTWGREVARTRPVPGNHEYDNGSAGIPYFNYFGTLAYDGGPGPGLGYYSFDFPPAGTPVWHVIALNSNLAMNTSSPQGQWLKNDLAASKTKCTIAYWHHPLFSSSQNGPQPFAREAWQQLYAAGVDIVMNGHDHVYERFGLQDPDGRPDPARGIREFVVGSGGATLYGFPTRMPNSEVQISAFGVLKLTLNGDNYNWQFIPVSGSGDAGTGQCH